MKGIEGMELTEGLRREIARIRGECVGCGVVLHVEDREIEDGLCVDCWLGQFRDKTPGEKT